MIIREAKVNDAENMLKMLLSLDSETKNMMFEKGERKTTPEMLRKRIANCSNREGITLLVEDNNEIGGFLSADRGGCNRIKHSAYIVIGILEKYTGRHLGTKMFIEMEKWAIRNNITRLELTVITTNNRAVSLYKKMGFKIEGTKEKSMIIDGKYVDEYYMAKIL